MDNLGMLLVLAGGFGIWYFIKKDKDNRKRNISIGVFLIGFALVGMFGSTEEKEMATTNSSASSAEVSTIDTSSQEKAKQEAEAQKQAEKEQQKKEQAEKEAQEAAEKQAEEEAKQAEEAAKKDPSTYRTDITYDNLARNPNDYLLEKIVLSGKIIQVIEGDESSQYRLAVDGNYDTVALIEISKEQLSSRILEDDYITIYGSSAGTITYQSTMGGDITVPALLVNMFEFN